ncbi:MAG: Amuc_1100 family pilus-like protein, partial [Verrucomicrobiota bacterium]|nr:Amuc_1100 family pilus-like protein [Verrucomicrobiota bacterium]
FRRMPVTETHPPVAASSPNGARKPAAPIAVGPNLIERGVVEASFVASPGATRRVLNQIATINQQFYILRTLHVLNEKDKGPPRETTATSATAATPPPAPGASPAAALNFIVGNEKVQTAARIEMLRFKF